MAEIWVQIPGSPTFSALMVKLDIISLYESEVLGSSPCESAFSMAAVVQLAEHRTVNPEAAGSLPVGRPILWPRRLICSGRRSLTAKKCGLQSRRGYHFDAGMEK